MEYIIKITHADGSGGNLIFDDKEKAISTYKMLNEKYDGTETELKRTTVEQQ